MFFAGKVLLIQWLGILSGFKAAKYAPTKFALEQLQPPALIVFMIADL